VCTPGSQARGPVLDGRMVEEQESLLLIAVKAARPALLACLLRSKGVAR
jgi:hypothetical protein